MWLCTTRGFFSAVSDQDNPGYVKVRARAEQDIRNLHELVPDAPDPVEWAGTDYRWRLLLTLEQWLTLAAELSADVFDYTNFKNAIQDKQRAYVYSEVWGLMLDELQDGQMWPDEPSREWIND